MASLHLIGYVIDESYLHLWAMSKLNVSTILSLVSNYWIRARRLLARIHIRSIHTISLKPNTIDYLPRFKSRLTWIYRFQSRVLHINIADSNILPESPTFQHKISHLLAWMSANYWQMTPSNHSGSRTFQIKRCVAW